MTPFLVGLLVVIVLVGAGINYWQEVQRGVHTQSGYKKAMLSDSEDPARAEKTQASYEWNVANCFRLKDRWEQVLYLRGKMHQASEEQDRGVRFSRYSACADLAHDLDHMPDLTEDLKREVNAHFGEALKRYHEYLG